jgi:hypothetical protein
VFASVTDPEARQARGLATLRALDLQAKKKASEPKPKIIKPNHPKSIRYTSTMVRTKKHFRPPSSSSSSSSEEEEDDDEINHQVPTGRGKQLGNFGRGKQLNMASQQGRGKQLRA